MAQFAGFSIYDGQATPVLKPFAAVDHLNDVWIWRDTAASSVLAAVVVTLTRLKVKGNSNMERYRKKIVIPALETATGANSSGYTAAPRIAYTLQSIEDIIIPSRATVPQRKDLIAFSSNLNNIAMTQLADVYQTGVMPT